MRMLIDTNVLLDFLLKRDPWHKPALAIWRANRNGELTAYMVASSLTDIAYIVEDTVSKKAARRAVALCIRTIEILPTDADRLQDAFDLNGIDFEDDLLIASASYHKLDGIISRDRKGGFLHSPLTVSSPSEFVKQLQRQRTNKNE